MTAKSCVSRTVRCVALIASPILIAAPAAAQTLLRVGKSVPEAFSFVPPDVDTRNGLFKKHGIRGGPYFPISHPISPMT